VHKSRSILSSVAASVTFNCSVTGNPAPEVTWYKNGRLLKNSYVAHYEQHTLRIQSIEPEDEGIYQCMAKNDVAEVVMSEWLTLRNKHQYKNFPHRPDNLRCYPLDYKSVLVTFETKESFHMINYYLSSEGPYTWESAPPQQVYANNSFHIVDKLKRFQPYALYLRGMQIEPSSNSKTQDRTHVMLTRLSRSVKCATQGREY
jgi:Immunoglobulin I-set domain